MSTENNIFFDIKTDEKIGRYAVASKNLKAGDFIFKEPPFAYGPKSDSPPLCLGCFAPIDCTVLCSKCAWPVCGEKCENSTVHRQNECQIFSQAQIKFEKMDDPSGVCLQYECITPLRVLLAKERDPNRWTQEISIMESHNEIRKTLPIWEFNQINIVEYIRGPLKLHRFPEDIIHKICGILEVNAFEARTQSGYLIRCLYPKLAILSHNCVSNIIHSINCCGAGNSDDFEVRVRAAVDVEEGKQLYSSYTYSLYPTLVRREFLKLSKYFDCKCERCMDKTELGTHMSTLKCSKCDNGVILSTDPLSDCCEWKCTHCEFKTSAVAVRKVFATIQNEIDNIEMLSGPEGIEAREGIFRKYRSVLHPKNAYMTILRTALSQLYGRAEGYTVEDLPDLLQERKVELCTQLLEVLDVVEPGHSRLRGITLYELHAPLIILARNQFIAGCFTKEEFRKKMSEAVDVLEESADILKNEPENSLEGQLGRVAQSALTALKDNFEILIETA